MPRRNWNVFVSQRLAEERVRLGVTVKELSAKTGISMLALHRKLAFNRSAFTVEEVASVAEALGMRPWQVFVPRDVAAEFLRCSRVS